jgi:hypothetical protein
MDNRYSLRFETGERTGETIPIQSGGFTIGRKPGNSLQILDASVSGSHAEIVLDPQGAQVRDVGSTNGTRVGEERVREARLAHGDRVTFGSVRMVFRDAQLETPAQGSDPVAPSVHASHAARAPHAAAAAEAPAAEGLIRVSAEVLARSKKRSRLGLVVVAVLAVVGGGAWYFLNHAGGGKVALVRAVEPVAGDLLADEFSFESEHDSWTPAEGSPAAFLKSEHARYAGSFGMGSDLGPGEWALQFSKAVRCDADRELEARAMLRAGAGVEMHLGIEFSGSGSGDTPPPGAITAWARAVSGTSGFEALALTAPVPPGYSSARLCVLARATAEGGNAAFDDASLVQRPAASKPVAQVKEHRLYFLGDPASDALLFKVDRVLLSNLEARQDAAGDSAARGTLSAAGDESKIKISSDQPLSPGGAWTLRAEAPVARERIATIAGGAYMTHAAAFEREGVHTLLLGSGNDLVDLKFAEPVRVTGVADGAASVITIQAPGQQSFDLQLAFNAEKKEAGNLAYAARNAEKKGDLGQCLKQWEELLNTYPYEEALVAEAERTRGRLIQQGLGELRALRTEIERARFFRLVDLYRQCRDKAVVVGNRYASSEVEAEAKRVAAEVDVDLAGLEADLARTERTRLTSIMNALEARQAVGLAGEVRAYLDSHYPEKK